MNMELKALPYLQLSTLSSERCSNNSFPYILSMATWKLQECIRLGLGNAKPCSAEQCLCGSSENLVSFLWSIWWHFKTGFKKCYHYVLRQRKPLDFPSKWLQEVLKSMQQIPYDVLNSKNKVTGYFTNKFWKPESNSFIPPHLETRYVALYLLLFHSVFYLLMLRQFLTTWAQAGLKFTIFLP